MKAKLHYVIAASVTLLAATWMVATIGSAGDGKASTRTVEGLTGPAAPKGETEEELTSISLANDVPGFENRRLRLRRVTVEPGGIVPIHSHSDRPAMLYVLEGTIYEHRSDRNDPVVHKAGGLAVEVDVAHWWENKGREPVVIVATDVFFDKDAAAKETAAGIPGPLEGPDTPRGYSAEILGTIDLAGQIDGVKNREMRFRVVTLEAGGIAPVHSHKDRPALFYVLKGQTVEHRSDGPGSLTHRAGSVTRAENGVSHWWKNTGDTDVVILVTDIFNTTGVDQES